MKNAIIIGADRVGAALVKIIDQSDSLYLIAVVDSNPVAPALRLAKERGIATDSSWEKYIDQPIDVVIETTGNESIFSSLREVRDRRWVIIPATVAKLISDLMEEQEKLINQLSTQSRKQDLVLRSTHDGMIAIDQSRKVTIFNKSAQSMTDLQNVDVIGREISELIPNSELPRILDSGVPEVNREQMLDNGRKIITTRTPMIDDAGNIVGAFAVFKDITEVVEMAEEVTSLKSVQTMLEAIIHSSEEAITVVDEDGKGLMVNPAYTRLTGLKAEDIYGKPATTDISEGESMHMKVLRTRKPVRGVRLKVGPNRRDVVVNVAPVIVDGKIKGSVGVIHDVSEIKSLTDELHRARQIIRTLEAKYSFTDIIGNSREMEFAVEQAKLGATTPATVLLRGESGTGKELFAHAIHNSSNRKYKKFVRVNCAAISESLLESELFGYEEGAFSGARKGGKLGLFEEANGGSIFLDEIGELSGDTQAKLLRVLQENEIIRVGGTKSTPIDVRVIAATNVNLEKRIIDGSFREDLYYRINRLPIFIPPLRERKEDLALLCNHLIQKLNQDYGRNIEGITEPAIRYLNEYDWPGNVRELENILGRAIIHLSFHESWINVEAIPSLNSNSSLSQKPILLPEESRSLQSQMEVYEKEVLQTTLDHCENNKTKTAKLLGISLRNLYYKLDKYSIE
ncbi:sigma-54-dependent Fis family transcriptional regulator [Alkalihalobacillus sp. AL-G]|uniref:sigma-54 interaction domain-containing protein n=1 Tax=Alkalihalobacillus sp. AL-G TaxID=2926399 RepID=UPI00272A5CF8|nr:sigma-54-dependent Fis family transcriptional regulator [Alkalihalobacillus sp. AL-G]WLD91977.1 sigma-54-dependent Fis family transcriptional regulator [Alkalihalobacillus sp. AL-G]